MASVFKTSSPKETIALAKEFASKLKKGDIVFLYGELGAGKTTFVQGLAQGLGISKEIYVCSPTFSLINEYPGPVPLYHVDLYRLEPEDIEDLGLEEFIERGILIIEWPEKISSSFIIPSWVIRIKILDLKHREIFISHQGEI